MKLSTERRPQFRFETTRVTAKDDRVTAKTVSARVKVIALGAAGQRVFRSRALRMRSASATMSRPQAHLELLGEALAILDVLANV